MADWHIVIERTFLHFPGIGHDERSAGSWAQGIKSWDARSAELFRNGTAPGDLVRRQQAVQFELFPGLTPPTLDPTAQAWRWRPRWRLSRPSTRATAHDFFLSRLPPGEHWRGAGVGAGRRAVPRHRDDRAVAELLPDHGHQGPLPGSVSPVGVAPACRRLGRELLRDAPVVVTFNGVPGSACPSSTRAHAHAAAASRAHRPDAGRWRPGRDGWTEAGRASLRPRSGRHYPRDGRLRGGPDVVAGDVRRRAKLRSSSVLQSDRRGDAPATRSAGVRRAIPRGRRAAVGPTAHASDAVPHRPRPLDLRRVAARHGASARGLPPLLEKLRRRLGREPVVVGIDLEAARRILPELGALRRHENGMPYHLQRRRDRRSYASGQARHHLDRRASVPASWARVGLTTTIRVPCGRRNRPRGGAGPLGREGIRACTGADSPHAGAHEPRDRP